MKSVVIIAVISLCLLFLRSEAVQVHDKIYLQTLYISGDDELETKMQFYNEAVDDIYAKGVSPEEVKQNSELASGKHIFTGHTELIVLNEKCDIKSTLEYMLNKWMVAPSCYVVISNAPLSDENISITAEKVKLAIKQGKAPKCDIITILSHILNKDKSAETLIFDKNGEFKTTKLNYI